MNYSMETTQKKKKLDLNVQNEVVRAGVAVEEAGLAIVTKKRNQRSETGVTRATSMMTMMIPRTKRHALVHAPDLVVVAERNAEEVTGGEMIVIATMPVRRKVENAFKFRLGTKRSLS